MTDCIRQHLILEGIVQNVGFRYEMTRLAHLHNLTGWVMNRVDGAVEAIVQGPPSAIQSPLGGAECLSTHPHHRHPHNNASNRGKRNQLCHTICIECDIHHIIACTKRLK
jgi:hypothetical protein